MNLITVLKDDTNEVFHKGKGEGICMFVNTIIVTSVYEGNSSIRLLHCHPFLPSLSLFVSANSVTPIQMAYFNTNVIVIYLVIG